eukprot:750109-Hanusia_phi.AAC.2
MPPQVQDTQGSGMTGAHDMLNEELGSDELISENEARRRRILVAFSHLFCAAHTGRITDSKAA